MPAISNGAPKIHALPVFSRFNHLEFIAIPRHHYTRRSAPSHMRINDKLETWLKDV